MNKFKRCIAVWLLFGSLPVSAAVPSKVVVHFDYETNLNFEARHVLEVSHHKIFLDQVQIPSARVLALQGSLKRILKMPAAKEEGAPCFAGKYRYRIVRDSKAAEVRGCISSLEFQELNRAFLRLVR